MKRIKKIKLVLFCVLLLLGQIKISVKAENTKGELPFSLYAKAAVLMDAKSGRVLFSKEGDVTMPNASTTKILTCILAIESGRLEEKTTASAYAASMPKVHLGMETGEQFLLKDLLYSLMLESHNDSAVVIAEHLGGTVQKFAEKMNQKAKELGCKDTYFITPNGLDAEDERGVHGTTATDLALLMSYCLKNETFLEITQTPNYSFSNIQGTKQYSCVNHNTFLTMMDGALTGKTGFTGNAGYCYVGALRRENRTFVVALLACGWPNNKNYKWVDTKNLMNYALENYQYYDVFEGEKIFSEIFVENARPLHWKLEEKQYVKPRLPKAELNILKKEGEEVDIQYDLPQKLKAPILRGQKIGEVRYYLQGDWIGTYDFLADKTIEKIEKDWYFQYVVEKLLFGA